MQITTENYYSAEADSAFMSNSQYKRYAFDCQTAAHACYDLQTYRFPQSKSMIESNYGHSLLDGSGEKFLAENPSLRVGKDKKDKGAAAIMIDGIWQRVNHDNYFMLSLTGEHEVIFTVEFAGVMWKCRIDVLNRALKFFSDLKLVKDLKDSWVEIDGKNAKIPFYLASKYHIQLALYQEFIRIVTGEKFTPYLPCATKEEVTDYEIYAFEGDEWDKVSRDILESVKYNMADIMAIKRGEKEPIRCNRCDYCKSTKRLTSTTMARF